MLERRRDDIAAGAIVLLTAALYVPFAIKGGWYLDDWDLYAKAEQTWWGGNVARCLREGDRWIACTYHASVFGLLGMSKVPYHLLSAAMVAASGALTYLLLVRCRLGRPWAFAAAVAFVLYPATDGVRLWPVGAIGTAVLLAVLVSMHLTLVALRTESRRRANVLHGVAIVIAVVALFTYEIAVSMVAMGGVVYVAAHGMRRPALVRGGIDLAIAGGYALFRNAFPYAKQSFTIERTTGETIDRGERLLRAGGRVWLDVFAPTGLRPVLVVVVGACAVLAVVDATYRRRAAPFLVAAGVSVVAGAGALFVYIRSPDFYTPSLTGTASRVNLGASVPSVVVIAAVLALAYLAVRRFRASVPVAAVAVGLLAAPIAWHEIRTERRHQLSWTQSWVEARAALPGLEASLVGLPRDASIVAFDIPEREAGDVPIFVTTWDLRGAVRLLSDIEPPRAIPFVREVDCGTDALTRFGEPFITYGDGPLYFVSPIHREAVPVRSADECRAVEAMWGRPPPFGSTVSASDAASTPSS